MDNIDYKILNLLQVNSRMTYTQISKEVNLSTPSVIERINSLMDKGILVRNTIEINYEKLGQNIKAIMCIDINRNKYEDFKKFCFGNTHVLEFYRVVGSYNAIIMVAFEDMEKLENFVDKIKIFGTCVTSIVTSTHFRNNILPKI